MVYVFICTCYKFVKSKNKNTTTKPVLRLHRKFACYFKTAVIKAPFY